MPDDNSYNRIQEWLPASKVTELFPIPENESERAHWKREEISRLIDIGFDSYEEFVAEFNILQSGGYFAYVDGLARETGWARQNKMIFNGELYQE